MDLGLLQTDVAKQLNVSADCVTYWENNRNEPQVKHYTRIIEFLGYFPLMFDVTTISGKLKAFRYENGLSQRRLATVLGVDTCTVRFWENEERTPSNRKLKNLELLLTKKPLD
ncbi:MAG: XRE family transcriptional regulator [Pedobacter sp.]|nr:MAG: XRE family transcriptional regulator [Pedobacter sp.]